MLLLIACLKPAPVEPPPVEWTGDQPEPAVVAAEPAPPRTPGPEDVEAVRVVVREHSRDVNSCYMRQVLLGNEANGRVDIAWTLDDQGVVTGTESVDDSTGNAELSPCIQERVSGWSFPAERAGRYTYSYDFSVTIDDTE